MNPMLKTQNGDWVSLQNVRAVRVKDQSALGTAPPSRVTVYYNPSGSEVVGDSPTRHEAEFVRDSIVDSFCKR